MKITPSPGLSLILGLWLGATLTVLSVVAWNFAGIRPALDANPKLRERAAIQPDQREERRASPIFVFAGELNRHIIYTWNRAQLALAAIVLLVALRRDPRAPVVLTLVVGAAIVLVLTFYLAPRIESIGRSIDFLPESTLDPRFAEFQTLHRAYVSLESVKTLILLVAAMLSLRAVKTRDAR